MSLQLRDRISAVERVQRLKIKENAEVARSEKQDSRGLMEQKLRREGGEIVTQHVNAGQACTMTGAPFQERSARKKMEGGRDPANKPYCPPNPSRYF